MFFYIPSITLTCVSDYEFSSNIAVIFLLAVPDLFRPVKTSNFPLPNKCSTEPVYR